jgi:hypothetical protein
MVNRILKIVFVLLCVVTFAYLSLPTFSFPSPPPDSLQSQEPADTEIPLRRAYFTNYNRAEVLEWYKSQFLEQTIFGIKLPTYLLNYPPEDSQSIIRDQTRSTYLQEVVHPFRESIYINGFEPKTPKDAIFIEGLNWEQKITVRFVPSSVWMRLGVFAFTAILIIVLYKEWYKSLSKCKNS